MIQIHRIKLQDQGNMKTRCGCRVVARNPRTRARKFGRRCVLLSITDSGSCLSHRISRFEKICELAGSSCYLRWNRTPASVFDIGYHKWISCRSARPCCDPPRKVSSVLEPWNVCLACLLVSILRFSTPPKNYILFIRNDCESCRSLLFYSEECENLIFNMSNY